MSTDIQRLASTRPSPELRPPPPTGGAAVSSAVPDLKPVELHTPTPVDIKVNTQEMAKDLQKAIEQINTMMRDGGRGLNFVIDNAVNQPIIKVTRAETGEVIRQIPNEVVVRVAHNLEKLQGILFSEFV